MMLRKDNRCMEEALPGHCNTRCFSNLWERNEFQGISSTDSGPNCTGFAMMCLRSFQQICRSLLDKKRAKVILGYFSS